MRDHRFHPDSGFTLLELLIAVTLSMAVVYTAMAGFRVLSQAITKSKQMSIENSLLRIGMQMALEEVDFWATSDDPIDTMKQPMRAGGNGAAGMPFTPFNKITDVITGRNFIDSRPGLDEIATSARGGWNPNPLAWAAWDQRTWTRSNMPETYNIGDFSGQIQYWGTFGLYENLDPAFSWHHWYGGQVLGLIDGLGFWGLYEYVPSNSFLTYHTNVSTQVPKGCVSPGLSWGGVPNALLKNDDWWGNQDGSDSTMKARIRNSNGAQYFMPGPLTATIALSRKLGKIGYEGRDVGWDPTRVIPQFMTDTAAAQQALAQRPGSWPDVSSEVRRFMERGHNLTSCTVTCVHPLTGEKIAISFGVVGTTLRGARQQRLPTTGWADPFSGPTLDYTTPNPLP